MEYRLIRATSADYRIYRKAFEKIEYSFFRKGEEDSSRTKEIMKNTFNLSPILGKGEYLDLIESPSNEVYFFRVDGNVIGIVILVFSETICTIKNFSVFEHGKGLGTLMFQETLNIIKFHQSKKIVLWCPYDGAQIFWKKMGFRLKEKYQPIPSIFKIMCFSKKDLQAIQQSFNASFEMRL